MILIKVFTSLIFLILLKNDFNMNYIIKLNMSSNIFKNNKKPSLCRREMWGLKCVNRNHPRTCPFLHKNETIEEYNIRIQNNNKFYRKQDTKTEEPLLEPEGEFYAYTYM